jgi:hypothetical protein
VDKLDIYDYSQKQYNKEVSMMELKQLLKEEIKMSKLLKKWM